MKLTKAVCDKACYEGQSYSGTDGYAKSSRYVLWDDAIASFGLRITPTGRKSFVLSYRASGRKRFLTLGTYGVLTLDQARNEARKVLSSVLDGADPVKERQEERRRAESAETIADFCSVYLDRHAKPRKKTWKEDARRIRAHILPKLGRYRLEEVTQEHVARLYRRIGSEHPYEANRVLALVSVLLNLASD